MGHDAPITIGTPVSLSKRVRRLTAGNPGVMTGPGTNTYLIGHEEIVVIDPGPDDPAHLDAIAAAGGDRIKWIVVTHTHPDHSPGAAPLRERLRPDVVVLGNQGGRDNFEPATACRVTAELGLPLRSVILRRTRIHVRRRGQAFKLRQQLATPSRRLQPADQSLGAAASAGDFPLVPIRMEVVVRQHRQ